MSDKQVAAAAIVYPSRKSDKPLEDDDEHENAFETQGLIQASPWFSFDVRFLWVQPSRYRHLPPT
jgi:hypothetical protein